MIDNAEKKQNILFSLLSGELQGLPINQDVQNALTPEYLSHLFKFAKQHDVVHLVGDALDKNGLLDQDAELKKRFLYERSMAVFRCEQLQYELECITQVFEQAQIAYLPLKGAVLRQYYKEPWMRTSCDIDILVHPEDVEKAVSALETQLQYTRGEESDHDVLLTSESGMSLELHYQLQGVEARETEEKVLTDIWLHARKSAGKEWGYELPDAYFYAYHISHIAKHLRGGGCGVRSVLDTWILNHSIEFDKNAREAVLQETRLGKVAKGLENLAEVWFSNQPADELSEILGEYIVRGGLYGSMANVITKWKNEKKNPVSYLFSRLFLPYENMKYKYPKLKKYPVLYPFYTVKRWCQLFQKDKKERALNEMSQIANSDEVRQARLAKMMQDLEL